METISTIRSNPNYWIAVRIVHLIVVILILGLGYHLWNNETITIRFNKVLSIILILVGLGVFAWHLSLFLNEQKFI